ncbi:MAG: hypothetical protein KC877_00230 [Candidatus Kaiserbacteria bacterium]|nr:hypothetical protein [Candidatus Kaiserbacteria bacterium]MCB9815860.1 hypothetical protein [Candidatus Nomurabacteria bacterium]
MASGVLTRVFRHRRYVFGAALVAFAVLTAGVMLPNWGILVQILFSGSIGLGAKLSFVFSLYGSIFTNFTVFSALYLLLIAVLFGINVGILTFYIRRRQTKRTEGAAAHLASIGGIVSAMLGIGCAACGSVVITAVLGLFGATGLLLLLPFHGIEFGVLGLILLIVSIRYLMRRINDPIVCPTKY